MSLRSRRSAKATIVNDSPSSSSDSVTKPPDQEDPSQTLPPQPSFSQRALTSTANLANLLPTGTLLAFNLLTPIFTNNGDCSSATRLMTLVLLALLAVSCFLASFTDSVKASDGRVYYGFATFRGLFLFDYPNPDAPNAALPDLGKYRFRFIDGVHAILSLFVFVALALRDHNVVRCFCPRPEQEIREVLGILPVGIGVLCSLLFVVFPTRRHGVGYPVTSGN